MNVGKTTMQGENVTGRAADTDQGCNGKLPNKRLFQWITKTKVLGNTALIERFGHTKAVCAAGEDSHSS